MSAITGNYAPPGRGGTRQTRVADGPPIYLALDLWMALGLSVREFDGYYERNGWADTWSSLLDAVRRRSNLARCELFADKEHCLLLADHIGPCMGWGDVGSTEPLPAAAKGTEA